MSDIEAEDRYDAEVDNDPEAIRELGTEAQENERFQTYWKPTEYPPGHERENHGENYLEVIEQPPVSIKTGFQTVASAGRILFAANGPDIHSFDIIEKTHLSSWKYPKAKNFPEIPTAPTKVIDQNKLHWQYQEDEPLKKKAKKGPVKRRKLNARGKKVDITSDDKVDDVQSDANDENGDGNDVAKKPKSGKGGPAAKRRKLDAKGKQAVVAPEDQMDDVQLLADDEVADGNDVDPETSDVAKGASSAGDVDKLDPFPARPVNPELWESGIVDPEDEPPADNGKPRDIDDIKYEKSSQRPPDFAPEGWKADQKANWRRPEFRPNRRIEWKPQPSKDAVDIPMVQCISVTKNRQHVVAVTGSDKTIWVFEHDGYGKLTVLSQRAMPKRPNAIAFANNDRTILSADKFGDVYALPLIPRNDVSQGLTPTLLSRSATPATAQPFKSQANEKTVHSKRNMKALENQRKQAQAQAEKEGKGTPNGEEKDPQSDFYHKLILGHVSMLTDIAVGKASTLDSTSGKTLGREWIITADRDEHIRVSRGMPQSHVIENFLLGHKEFISRIHIPERFPNILISGGGDSYVYVWDYMTGELRFKHDLRKALVKMLDDDLDGDPPLAVSGIVSYHDYEIDQTRVFVICENIPRAFTFHIDDEQILGHVPEEALFVPQDKPVGQIALASNPLGITTFSAGESRGIIISYDPWTAGEDLRLQSKAVFIEVIEPEGLAGPPKMKDIPAAEGFSEEIAFTFHSDWARALYTIEPLRKNCHDRDIAQKDEAGNWGSKASSG